MCCTWHGGDHRNAFTMPAKIFPRALYKRYTCTCSSSCDLTSLLCRILSGCVIRCFTSTCNVVVIAMLLLIAS